MRRPLALLLVAALLIGLVGYADGQLLPTSFRPTKIAGLQLWLKADAITGLNDGDSVTTWSDSSGQGNDATQATAAAKPTLQTNEVNGRPIVRFDGVDDYLAAADAAGLDFSTAATIFAVVVTSDTVFPILSHFNAASPFEGWEYGAGAGGTAGKQYFFDGSNPVDWNEDTGTAVNTGAATIMAMVHDSAGSGVTYYKDGTAGGTLATQSIPTSTNSIFVGADSNTVKARFLTGDIAEIIVYNSALSTADRRRVQRYLGRRYGITVTP